MLTEPILLLETAEGRVRGTLPDALAKLCDGTLTGFDGLAAHQRHAFDLFLYQTTALALARSGEAAVAEDDAAWRRLADPTAWRARLASLTPGCADTAWSLVAEDIAQPALLQPPVTTGSLEAYKPAGTTPDEIDLLVTAKNHDVKAARAGSAEPRHWLFALLALQTLQGYSGRGNFGIARMNGGFASRALVMMTPSRDMATCFRRGVQAALQARASLLGKEPSLYAGDGLPLLWLEPWDREAGVPLQRLDPLFVEIARRIRLVRAPGGGIVAYMRPSEAPRVAAPKELKGNLGDPWVPVATGGEALTVGGGGFDYRLISRLLDAREYILPLGAVTRPEDRAAPVWLRTAVLVRGQGKTEGLHERWVRLPGRARQEGLGALSHGMVLQAKDARQALRLSLLRFLQGGSETLKFEDARPDAALDAFEQDVDAIFFTHLHQRGEADSDDEAALEAETEWKQALVTITRARFKAASAYFTPPGNRCEKSLALAALTLGGALRKAQLLTDTSTPEEHALERAG